MGWTLIDVDNPWNTIPLTDYKGHMALPAIGQANMLSREFGRLLNDHPAKAVALIGCSGGNGFAAAADAGVARLVGLDINAGYIAEAGRRFLPVIAGLELHCADIQEALPPIVPVDLVFAALIFEYVDVTKAMRNIAALCRPGAVFGALVQLPRQNADAVSPSPYESLRNLRAILRLVPPATLRDAALTAGFTLLAERTIELSSGKSFSHQIFRAASDDR